MPTMTLEPPMTAGQDAIGTTSGLLLSELREERQRVHRLKEWFRHSYESSLDWRRKAIESYRYVANQQWDDQDLAKLQRERRPALVINKILSPVLFLGGVQRQQRREVKVLGAEPGDTRKAELMQALYKWVSATVREPETDSKVFFDKIITGLGFWKLGVDFLPTPEGQITIERVSPLAVFTDPNWCDNGWKASKFVMHALWRQLDELLEEFPEKVDEIRSQYGEWISGGWGESGQGVAPAQATGEEAGDSFSSRRMFWDAETQRARVLECWYSETVKVKVGYDRTTGVVETEEQHVAGIEQALQAMPELSQRLSVLERPVKRVRVAKLLNDVLLSDEPSPYKEQCFPLFPALGHMFWEWPLGMVEYMKDPQREINRRRSSVIEIVRRMPHSGWLNQRTQGAKTEDLEQFAKGSGFVINYEQVKPEQTDPPELPQTLVYLERANAQEVRDVVNINAELTGNTTQRTVSGRAIEARQRGGLTVQEPLLESFDHEKEEAVIFLITLIQQFTSLPRAVRALGQLAIRQPMTPEGMQIQQMDQMELTATLSQAFSTKFDILVKSQPFHPSVQAERWDTLTELAQMFGGAIPPQVLVDAAKNAGVLDEADAQQILMHLQGQQQQQALEQQAAEQGMRAAAGAPPAQAARAA